MLSFCLCWDWWFGLFAAKSFPGRPGRDRRSRWSRFGPAKRRGVSLCYIQLTKIRTAPRLLLTHRTDTAQSAREWIKFLHFRDKSQQAGWHIYVQRHWF
jgi:hypothetical protein